MVNALKNSLYLFLQMNSSSIDSKPVTEMNSNI